jgi:hypothetical protein
VVVSDLRILDGDGQGPAELDLLYGQGDSMAMVSDGGGVPGVSNSSTASDDDGLPF